MAISSDKDRPTNPWREALQEAATHLTQIPVVPGVTPLREATSTNLRQALEMDARILTAENLQETATRLALRHQEHIVGPTYVRAMLQLKDNHTDIEGLTMLKALRQRANSNGFFIMDYSPEMMMERLISPQYLIAESYGRHPDPQSPLHRVSSPAADCQCWFPEAVANPAEHVDLPDQPADRLYGKAEKYLRSTLSSCGEVKDISSSIQMNNLGLAGAARRLAFRHIKDVVNPARGDHPINFMAASIAELGGIILPDGTKITMEDVKQMSGIKNERSMAIHTGGSFPARHAYTLSDRTVDVQIGNETYQILVDWYYFIHDLRDNH